MKHAKTRFNFIRRHSRDPLWLQGLQRLETRFPRLFRPLSRLRRPLDKLSNYAASKFSAIKNEHLSLGKKALTPWNYTKRSFLRYAQTPVPLASTSTKKSRSSRTQKHLTGRNKSLQLNWLKTHKYLL